MKATITIDVHFYDSPKDITFACEWLRNNNITATFFVPSNLFYLKKFNNVLKSIPLFGHEVASHSHWHDFEEINALTENDERKLAFLTTSKKLYEDFFGNKPTAFRAPCWCFLSKAALDKLEELEYLVDSSATPQRLSILSSKPFKKAWTFTPRDPYYIRPSLLEIPNSCFLLPGGSTTFATLRSLNYFFLSFLIFESRFSQNRFLNLQFHPNDFNPNSKFIHRKISLKLVDFIPISNGGFGFRHLLTQTNSKKLCDRTYKIIERLNSFSFLSITDASWNFNNSFCINSSNLNSKLN